MINEDQRDQSTAAAAGGRDRGRPTNPSIVSATRTRLTLPGNMAKKASIVAAAIGLVLLLLVSYWSRGSFDNVMMFSPEVRFRCGLRCTAKVAPAALSAVVSTHRRAR